MKSHAGISFSLGPFRFVREGGCLLSGGECATPFREEPPSGSQSAADRVAGFYDALQRYFSLCLFLSLPPRATSETRFALTVRYSCFSKRKAKARVSRHVTVRPSHPRALPTAASLPGKHLWESLRAHLLLLISLLLVGRHVLSHREVVRTSPVSPNLNPEGLAGSRRSLCSLPRVTVPSGGLRCSWLTRGKVAGMSRATEPPGKRGTTPRDFPQKQVWPQG